MHEPEVGAHGEGRREDVADANADVVAVIGVSLSRSGGIIGAEICRRNIFEFPLVRVPPVQSGTVAEVVVNAGAVSPKVGR